MAGASRYLNTISAEVSARSVSGVPLLGQWDSVSTVAAAAAPSTTMFDRSAASAYETKRMAVTRRDQSARALPLHRGDSWSRRQSYAPTAASRQFVTTGTRAG